MQLYTALVSAYVLVSVFGIVIAVMLLMLWRGLTKSRLVHRRHHAEVYRSTVEADADTCIEALRRWRPEHVELIDYTDRDARDQPDPPPGPSQH